MFQHNRSNQFICSPMLSRTLLVMCLVVFSPFQDILIEAWPTLQVTIHNYTQTYNAAYVEYTMVPSSNTSGAYDIRLNVQKSNIKPVAKFGVYFENVEFMNKTINVCRVANSRNEEPLLKLIYKVLTGHKKAHYPNECPFKKGKYYNFLDPIETNKIPPVWPEKNVSIYIDIFSKESNILVPVLSQTIHCQFNRKRSKT